MQCCLQGGESVALERLKYYTWDSDLVASYFDTVRAHPSDGAVLCAAACLPQLEHMRASDVLAATPATLWCKGARTPTRAYAHARAHVRMCVCVHTRTHALPPSQRNGMLGADYSTKLAPWLAAGCISPRTIHHGIKAYEAQRGANKSTYWCAAGSTGVA